jgi:hypothetical protein
LVVHASDPDLAFRRTDAQAGKQLKATFEFLDLRQLQFHRSFS